MCVLQSSEIVRLLGLQDAAQTVCRMSPVSLLTCSPVKTVGVQRTPFHFQVSAATFFENKNGKCYIVMDDSARWCRLLIDNAKYVLVNSNKKLALNAHQCIISRCIDLRECDICCYTIK